MTQQKRTVKAQEVVNDIRAGITDSYLMKKYDLTSRQLELLLQKLVAKGYLTEQELDSRISLEDTAVTKAFIDVQQSVEALDDTEVTALITQGRRTTGSPKRKIKTRNLVEDIKAGVNDSQLMQKYELAANQLEYMLARLLDSGKVTEQQLEERISLSDTSITRAFMDVQRSIKELEDLK